MFYRIKPLLQIENPISSGTMITKEPIINNFLPRRLVSSFLDNAWIKPVNKKIKPTIGPPIININTSSVINSFKGE